MKKRIVAWLAIAVFAVGIGIAMAHATGSDTNQASNQAIADRDSMPGMGMMGGMMGMMQGMQGMMEMHEEMEELHERFSNGEITREEFINEMAKEMAENWDSMPCHR